ncbi:MAG: Flp family type IVb pilin [Alphaproteobacteria bacterium]|nr:Flp family type IVb pilin [Alphaproteobacteria bacterium]
MRRTLLSFARSKDGATAIEYAVIAAILAIAVVAGATLFGSTVNSQLKTVADKVAASP